jgi:hypothetical protein
MSRRRQVGYPRNNYIRVGATPRIRGAKNFIDDEGGIHGNHRRGFVEAESMASCKICLVNRTMQESSLRPWNGKTVEDEGMICGGYP